MSDYRTVMNEANEQAKDMRRKGILAREKVVYVTPDGTEYRTIASALNCAPNLTGGEDEEVWDRNKIIGYRRARHGSSQDQD